MSDDTCLGRFHHSAKVALHFLRWCYPSWHCNCSVDVASSIAAWQSWTSSAAPLTIRAERRATYLDLRMEVLLRFSENWFGSFCLMIDWETEIINRSEDRVVLFAITRWNCETSAAQLIKSPRTAKKYLQTICYWKRTISDVNWSP